MSKIKGTHLIFKTSIARVKSYLLIDNENEAKLIDESFVYPNKISSFKLKKLINFTLKNSEIVQKLTKKPLLT